MSEFRKKPVVVSAVQWDGANWPEVSVFCPAATYGERDPAYITIPTLEGDMWANMGDWVIRGIKGEFYPCKPDIFAATYEPASTSSGSVPTPTVTREQVEALPRFDTPKYDDIGMQTEKDGDWVRIEDVLALFAGTAPKQEDTARLDAIESRLVEVECMGTTIPYLNVTNAKGFFATTAASGVSFRAALDDAIADATRPAGGETNG